MTTIASGTHSIDLGSGNTLWIDSTGAVQLSLRDQNGNGFPTVPVGGGGSVTQGTNISVVGSVVSTVLTGFLAQQNSTDSVGATKIWQKSRGSSGAPTIVSVGDLIGHDIFQPYDGVSAAYLPNVDVGAYVTPGATLTSGVIPTSWYVQVKPDGVLTDPGNSTTRVFMQGMPCYPSGTPVGGGFLLLNFPGNTTAQSLALPGGTANEVAHISVLSQSVTGPLSPGFALYRPNSAGTPTHNGYLGWTFQGGGGNTAGAEKTFFELGVMYNGSVQTAMNVTGNAAGSQMQLSSGTAAVPGLAFLGDSSHNTGWSMFLGSGNDFDLGYIINGHLIYKMFEAAGSVGNEPHYFSIQPVGSASAGYTVRGATLSGLFYEQNNGGIYLDAVGSCVQIGPSGYKATNSTSGFLALSTTQGTPTGTPAFLGTGKSPIVYDETGGKLWVYNLSAAAWKSVALA